MSKCNWKSIISSVNASKHFIFVSFLYVIIESQSNSHCAISMENVRTCVCDLFAIFNLKRNHEKFSGYALNLCRRVRKKSVKFLS